MVAFNAEWLVDSLDTISTSISKEWIALIMLPAISSIAGECHTHFLYVGFLVIECLLSVPEISTAVNVSVKDQLTLSVSVAVSSTIVSLSKPHHTLHINYEYFASKRPYLSSRVYFVDFVDFVSRTDISYLQTHGDVGMDDGQASWFAI